MSREHARIDAGSLCVRVTDLGSSKGTRLGGATGAKLTTEILSPGQTLHIGAYTLTLELEEAESGAPERRSSGGSLFHRRLSSVLPRVGARLSGGSSAAQQRFD